MADSIRGIDVKDIKALEEINRILHAYRARIDFTLAEKQVGTYLVIFLMLESVPTEIGIYNSTVKPEPLGIFHPLFSDASRTYKCERRFTVRLIVMPHHLYAGKHYAARLIVISVVAESVSLMGLGFEIKFYPVDMAFIHFHVHEICFPCFQGLEPPKVYPFHPLTAGRSPLDEYRRIVRRQSHQGIRYGYTGILYFSCSLRVTVLNLPMSDGFTAVQPFTLQFTDGLALDCLTGLFITKKNLVE